MLSKSELIKLKPHVDLVFRYIFIPQVIVKLLWDYVDTVLIYASQFRNPATKSLTRQLRSQQKKFLGYSLVHRSADFRVQEEKKMYAFEEQIDHIMSQMIVNLRISLREANPDLDPEKENFLVAIHQITLLFEALLAQQLSVCPEVDKVIGRKSEPFLSGESYSLYRAMIQYLEGTRITRLFHDGVREQYVFTLANQIQLIKNDGLFKGLRVE